MNKKLLLRKIQLSDCEVISSAFKAQGWDKPTAQYEKYFSFQENGERDVIIAEYNQEFVGYLTIKWQSNYPLFQKKGIPEIVDFNVLKKYQRLGVGTALMDEAEERIKRISAYAGIGFGLYKDYGAAQILYIKRGYLPDGNGLIKDNFSVKHGDVVTVDDGLALCLIKEL
ncbi:MAG: GNAT family N-acetyltransferase [Saprospiraceae bacterium]